MLVIQRTEEGRLRLSDRRRTGLADGEAEARRTLYHWGYTELSITKALAEMRRAEGTLPPLAPWRVTRPADRAGERAYAAPSDPGESMKEKEPAPRKRRRATKAAPAQAQPAEEAPAEEVPAKGVEAEAVPAEAAPRPAAPRRARKRAPASEPAATPEPPPSPPEEEPRPAAPARGRRAARPAVPPEASPDPLAQAQALFAEGTRVLRQIEAGTLPFARGPWTELRAQAEHILACLKG